MEKIVIAITGNNNSNKNIATQDQKDEAYKTAIDKFTNDKNDVDVDTLRKILKAISSLLEIKENDGGKIDENFYEQTEPRKEANHLFE